MRKIVTRIIILLGLLSTANAQEVVDYTPQWPEKHILLCRLCPLQVARISNWAPDYLTVTDNFDNWLFHKAPSTLGVMCVITEINGQSTKGMSPQTFYNIMYEATSVKLTYLRKENGANIKYMETVTKPKGHGLVEDWSSKLGRQWTLTDEDVDFFEFNTYDFVINESSNQLEQKQLLKKFAEVLDKMGMRRSTEDPDIYLYVTLNSNENIESVYQPRTITTTSSDSYGTTNVYAFSRNNRRYADVRSNSNTSTRTTTRDVGTMRTYVFTDAYIELTVLDAKKTNQSNAPKVWQYKYEGRVDGSVSLQTYEEWISNNARIYPFGNNSNFGPKIHIGRDENSKSSYYGLYTYKGQISYVYPNSFASKYGIKIGDKIEASVEKVKNSSILLAIKGGRIILYKIGDVKIKKSMLQPIHTIENSLIANW